MKLGVLAAMLFLVAARCGSSGSSGFDATPSAANALRTAQSERSDAIVMTGEKFGEEQDEAPAELRRELKSTSWNVVAMTGFPEGNAVEGWFGFGSNGRFHYDDELTVGWYGIQWVADGFIVEEKGSTAIGGVDDPKSYFTMLPRMGAPVSVVINADGSLTMTRDDLVVVGIPVVSCDSIDSCPRDELKGTEWRVVSMGGFPLRAGRRKGRSASAVTDSGVLMAAEKLREGSPGPRQASDSLETSGRPELRGIAAPRVYSATWPWPAAESPSSASWSTQTDRSLSPAVTGWWWEYLNSETTTPGGDSDYDMKLVIIAEASLLAALLFVLILAFANCSSSREVNLKNPSLSPDGTRITFGTGTCNNRLSSRV